MQGSQRQIQDDHVPHRLARQTPEDVPLLLVADCSAADRDRLCSDELPQPRKGRVPRVDGKGKAEIACCVLVPDVGDSGVWQCRETLECGVHLCACTFEEDATTCDEERVACKDGTTTGGLGRVGHVVADRVLGVTVRGETSGKYPRVGLGWVSVSQRKERERERKYGLDVERFADRELIASFG